MIWKITYSVDRSFRNCDNYPDYESGETESVEGNTINEAIDNLFSQLSYNKELDSIIETHAKGLSSWDDCNDINIISVDKIVKSIDLDIVDHNDFKKLVEKRKQEIKEKNNEIERKKKAKKKRQELEQLKKLKEKYELKK